MSRKPRKFVILRDKGIIAHKIEFTYVKPELTKVHISVDVKYDITNDHFTLRGNDYNLYFKSAFNNKGNNIPAGKYELYGKIQINTKGYRTKDLSEFKPIRLDLSLSSKNIKCRAMVRPKVYVSRQLHDRIFQEYNKKDIGYRVKEEKDTDTKYTPYKKNNIRKPFQGGGCSPK